MQAECCICIGSVNQPADNATDEDHPVATKCGHIFHHSCLTTWLKQKAICPSCKHSVRKGSYFRLFVDAARLSGEGTAAEPVDLDGGDPAAVRRAAAEARRNAMLEEELQHTRAALDGLKEQKEAAERERSDAQAKAKDLNKTIAEQALIHQYDRDEKLNKMRQLERLEKEHKELQDNADRWQKEHEQMKKAGGIANGDEPFDPSIDRPEVLKWANKELVKHKAELKRQVGELRRENERLQRAAEAAKKRERRHKEKEKERRKQREGGAASQGSQGRVRREPADAGVAARQAALLGEQCRHPPGDSQQSQPSQPSQEAEAAAAAVGAGEQSLAVSPPVSPKRKPAAAAAGGAAAAPTAAAGASGEETDWASALLQEELAWGPSPPPASKTRPAAPAAAPAAAARRAPQASGGGSTRAHRGFGGGGGLKRANTHPNTHPTSRPVPVRRFPSPFSAFENDVALGSG